MHAFSRSTAYRLWVLLGLPATIALIVAQTVTADPGSQAPLGGAIAVVGAWVTGLLVLGGAVMARDRRAALGPASAPVGSSGVPAPADVLEALSLAAPGEARRASRALHNFSAGWFAALALFVAGIFVAVALQLAGWGAGVLLVPVGCVLVSALLVPATVARARRLSDRQLAPLGLAITGMPGLMPMPEADGEWRLGVRGATRLGGVRHGRSVSIAVDVRSSAVEVAGSFPALRVESTRDGLRLVEGPAGALAELVERVGGDARWRGAEVVGGPSGVVVRRPGRPSDLEPLLDLWLAERVADAATLAGG